jgi:hypothetical protein
VLNFEDFYIKSKYHEFNENQYYAPVKPKKEADISIFREFYLILYRALICQIRNPMDVFFKTVQSVFTAVIVLLVFGSVTQR